MLNFLDQGGFGDPGAMPFASQREAHAWDTELFVVHAADRASLISCALSLRQFVDRNPSVDLKNLASTLADEPLDSGACLTLVAGSAADLSARLARAGERLADASRSQIKDAAGIYYFDRPLYDEGGLALLFPGEGAQYLNMLTDLAPHFPEVAQILADAEQFAEDASPASGDTFRTIFRLAAEVTDEQRASAERALRQLDAAMFSVMLADNIMFRLLSQLGLRPTAIAGHSMGEIIALQAAGCIEQSASLLASVGTVFNSLLSREAAGEISPAVLLAVGAGKRVVEQIIKDTASGGAYLAMDNCPHQSVVVGPPETMTAVEAELRARRLLCERLPFDRPYHTPMFDPYLGPLQDLFEKIEFRPPLTVIYSCSTGLPFPERLDDIRRLAVRHYATPVEFTRLIKNMYADGVRLFVECGPRGNLTSFAEDILRGERFAAIASNLPHRSGTTQLNHLAAQLTAHHVPLNLTHLYTRRNPQTIRWDRADTSLADTEAFLPEAAVRQNDTTVKAPSDDPPALPAAMRRASDENDATTVAAATSYEGDMFPAQGVWSNRSEVVVQHFTLMDQFLDDQSAVLKAFLARATLGDDPAIDDEQEKHGEKMPSLSHLPMLRTATIVRLDNEIVVHRNLDLEEDLFVSHHTVGGRAISKVDPGQHGLPVMPMTFTLEMMAELASVVVPGHIVAGLKQVRLYRWLAFDEHEPKSIEITAQLLMDAAQEPGIRYQVRVAIRELGTGDAGVLGPAAESIVLLGESLPEPPSVGDFPLTNERTSPISLETLYKNLFHGPLFQGARSGGRSGDEGNESHVLVLPRDHLLRSDPHPTFLLDPILLDVSMHPLSGWHLEFPDQSGRIMLPIELGKLELFGSQPDVGARFASRSSLAHSSYRNFTHEVDLIDQYGKLWSRMHRLVFWRFYVPFAEVNFYGPKDEYFISKSWQRAVPCSDTAASCIRLDIPPDQKQASMRIVTARVTLAPSELTQFRSIVGDESREGHWLFGRLAAKDAVRLLWHARHGERLFPADVVIEMNENGGGAARQRGPNDTLPFARIAVAQTGDILAGFAAFTLHAGIALARMQEDGADSGNAPADNVEGVLLDRLGADRDEWRHRLSCAKQAVAQALNCAPGYAEQLLDVCHADAKTGRVKITLRSPVGERFSDWRSKSLIAQTARDGDLIVATTVCESESR